MDGILESMDKSSLTEEQILEVKSKMKEMDKKLKEMNKPKTITISSYDHKKIKKYCSSLNLNIGDWVTSILLEKIEDDNCIIRDKFDDEDYVEHLERKSNELIQKYKYKKRDVMFKTNKILVNKNFEFVGYSSLDANPIYGCDNSLNFKLLLDENSIEYKSVSKSEIGNGIYYNLDLEVEILN